MNLIENVWNLASQVCSDLKYVRINKEIVDTLGRRVSNYLKTTRESTWPVPPFIKSNQEILLYELIANSVNYCYWYGRSDLRPNDSSSIKMYECLNNSFLHIKELEEKRIFSTQQRTKEIIINFRNSLIFNQFPLLDKRIKHLEQIIESEFFTYYLMTNDGMDTQLRSIGDWLEVLLTNIPGFAEDLFLKRAILWIYQGYRGAGLFKKEIGKLPIPADYQIPKMLEYFGCIEYCPELKQKIQNSILIQEGSLEEIEIRAASIVVCSMLAEKAECTCEQIDTYLWTKRKDCPRNFHLTITSNY